MTPRSPLLLLLPAFLLIACEPTPAGDVVPLWGRWERTFTAAQPADPTVDLTVTLTAPDGSTRTVDGFWDGDATWRVRFMPDVAGTWQYTTTARPPVEGLDGQEGRFTSQPADSSANPFLRHGAVRVAETGTYLAHRDATPFFWLGDTAWNGALLSDEADWDAYLADRTDKRFTAIQFVTTPWRTAFADAEGQVAYTATGDSFQLYPAFFQRLDRRVDAVNAAGLLAAPVLLWALGNPEESPVPGQLPEDQAIRLARYLVARYGAHHVLWILGGDENYSEERTERWQRIGRAVFDTPHHAPVTLHPQGMQWHFDAFQDEPWLDVLIYQSGHGDDAHTLQWIHSGPPARKWAQTPVRPVINSEPPYEAHIAYQSRRPHTAYNVRRAVYWSLLNAPTAGVTYGAHGVWSWESEPRVPLNHQNTGVAQPWHEAMALPGSTHMMHMAGLFMDLPWWTLRPDSSLLAAQPGTGDPARFVAAARSDTGDLALFYLPVGGTVTIMPGTLPDGLQATWYDPREGTRTPAGTAANASFTAPDEQDWVLVLQASP